MIWCFVSHCAVTAERGHQVDVLGDSIGVSMRTNVVLSWDVASVFPALNASDYTVDIELYEFDVTTRTWKEQAFTHMCNK